MQDNMEDDTETPGRDCMICFDICVQPQTLHPCGHVLCLHCITQWSSRDIRQFYDREGDHVTCPMCRTVVESYGLNRDLDQKLRADYRDAYKERLQHTSRDERMNQPQLDLDRPINVDLRRIFYAIIAGFVIALLAKLIGVGKYLMVMCLIILMPFASNPQTRLWYFDMLYRRMEKMFYWSPIRPNHLELAIYCIAVLGFSLFFLAF